MGGEFQCAETIVRGPANRSNAGMNALVRHSPRLPDARREARSSPFTLHRFAGASASPPARRSSAWPTRCSCGRGPALRTRRRLVDVGRATNGQGFDNFGYQVLLALQQARQLEGIAGFRLDANAVSLDNGRGGSERAYATPSPPTTSRCSARGGCGPPVPRADEDRVPDGGPVVVISHAFWLRRFGGARRRRGHALSASTAGPTPSSGSPSPDFTGPRSWAPTCGCPSRWRRTLPAARRPWSCSPNTARSGTWASRV